MSTQGPRPAAVLRDPSARTLVAGELEAVLLPGYGMLGASLRHRGVELLRRIEDLEGAAANGSTAGIPLPPRPPPASLTKVNVMSTSVFFGKLRVFGR